MLKFLTRLTDSNEREVRRFEPTVARINELEPEYAAWLLGFFAARAGLPPIPDAPGVRPIQLAQLEVVLPWACRLLALPPPGG